MGLPRGLKPAAGVFLGLGAGCILVALDADSEARRRAAALRREVLTTALRRRLIGEATAATSAFYVVTGPDAHLTSLGRESVSRALLCGRAESLRLHSARSDAGGDDGHGGVLSRRPARLAVPYDLTLGTGQFSLLVERQMLRSQNGVVVAHGGGHGGSEQLHNGDDGVEQQHSHSSPWGKTAGEAEPEEEGSPLSPPSTATATQTPPPVTIWESLVLWATPVVLDGQQLDDAALWALERALSGVESHDQHISNQDHGQEGLSLPAGPIAGKSCNFILEVRQPAPATTEGGAVEKKRSEPGELCGDLARLGWRLVSLGLGSVVVSSSNPWILAELQQALLQHPAAGREGGSEEPSEESSDEVVVVRVALPSAAERTHSVLAVARDVGVDDHLSAADVSMLADLTGGRRAELQNVLERVKQASSGAATTVSEACQAAVDDQARALAVAWGLLPLSRDITNLFPGSSDVGDHEAVAVAERVHAVAAGGSTPSASLAAAGGNGDGDGDGDGGGRADGGEGTSREGWAPLWEAMGMLSVPSVSVGAVGAGPATSAPSLPPGSIHPAELLDECALDGETLLRLTKEGWLELSPAAPPISGTVLEHPGPPPLAVTVHLASVPLESLSRGVDRSFVGAPPLRLAAFRRLLDHRRRRRRDRSWAVPPSSSNHQGIGGHIRCEDLDIGVGRELGYGGDVAYGAEAGSNGDGGAAEGQESYNGGRGGLEVGEEAVDAGGGAAGQGDQELEVELERAGCLIEASVLSREHARQSAVLSEDGRVLSSHWAELGTARRDLERVGKDDETSHGEWAEVQLELIRQERAVVARAIEMRARRARVNSLRRDILGLEKSTGLRRPSPPEEYGSDSFSSLSSKEEEEEAGAAEGGEPVRTAQNIGASKTMGLECFSPGGFAEEMVLRDAERGVRLMPLLGHDTEKSDGGSGSDGVGGAGGGGRGGGRRVSVGRLWRWVRGS